MKQYIGSNKILFVSQDICWSLTTLFIKICCITMCYSTTQLHFCTCLILTFPIYNSHFGLPLLLTTMQPVFLRLRVSPFFFLFPTSLSHISFNFLSKSMISTILSVSHVLMVMSINSKSSSVFYLWIILLCKLNESNKKTYLCRTLFFCIQLSLITLTCKAFVPSGLLWIISIYFPHKSHIPNVSTSCCTLLNAFMKSTKHEYRSFCAPLEFW